MLCDAFVLYLLRFVISTLCAATFSNSYVKWHLRYGMLRFVAVPAIRSSLGHIKQFRIPFNTMRIITLISQYWEGNSLLFATITPERAGSVFLVFVLFWFWANNRKHVICYTICLYSVQFIQCTVYIKGNLKIKKGSKHRIRISPKTFHK